MNQQTFKRRSLNWTAKFSVLILLMSSLIGIIFLQTLFHELSHRDDFKDIAKGRGICLLNYPSNLTIKTFWNDAFAYYSFSVNKTYREEYERIEKYTEWKAYSVLFLIYLVWLFSLILCFWFLKSFHTNI